MYRGKVFFLLNAVGKKNKKKKNKEQSIILKVKGIVLLRGIKKGRENSHLNTKKRGRIVEWCIMMCLAHPQVPPLYTLTLYHVYKRTKKKKKRCPRNFSNIFHQPSSSFFFIPF